MVSEPQLRGTHDGSGRRIAIVASTFNETFVDPQVVHRKMVVEIEDPDLGTVRQAGIPIKLSETPGEIRSLGVPDGAHSEEILLELGYSHEEIRKLQESRAIG